MGGRKMPPDMLRRYGSARGFRVAKRTALREVERAVAELSRDYCCAPGYDEVVVIERKIGALKKLLSEKEWGR